MKLAFTLGFILSESFSANQVLSKKRYSESSGTNTFVQVRDTVDAVRDKSWLSSHPRGKL